MEFKKSTLGEIALEIKTGKTPPTSNPEYFGDELNWYTPTDLDREKILGNSKRRITQKALNDKKVVVLKPNTILLGCIGDIGKIGLIKESASSNQQITGILPKEEIVNSEFLYYWLKNNKNRLRDTSTSAIVPILNNKQLSTIKIEFPESIEDQIRIAGILTQAESLIVQRKESITLLDELLKSTFLEMFGDPVRNEKGWDKDSFDNLVDSDCPLTYGIVQPGEEFANGVPVIRPVDLTKTYIDITGLKLIDPKISDKFKRTLLKGKEILICVRGTTGVVALASKELVDCNVTRGIVPIWFSHNYNTFFAFGLLKSKSINNEIQSLTYGATLQQINLSDLRKIKLINPPIDLQNQYGLIVKKVETLKNEYEASLKELENMYRVLSQKAFKGELKVKEYTNNEELGMVAETEGGY
jgi:type I restriction enzyme S subunit